MSTEAMYELTREFRDRARSLQRSIVPGDPDWEPAGDYPRGDTEMFWFLQGKAEAFAAVMSEIEHTR